MELNKKNNIKLRIENVLTSSGNLIIVDKGNLLGEDFSNNQSKNFLLTLCKFSGTTIEQMEIVKVIAKSGNNLTLERAVEPCPLNYNSSEMNQIPYEFSVGDLAFMNLTAGEINKFGEEIQNLQNSKVDKNDQTITKQGNSFNGRNQLVQLRGDGKLPVLDGRNLTNLKSQAQNLMVKMMPGEKIGKIIKNTVIENINNGAKTSESSLSNGNTSRSISRIELPNYIRKLKLKLFCRITSSLSRAIRVGIRKNSGVYDYTEFLNVNSSTREFVINLDKYGFVRGDTIGIEVYNPNSQTIYIETKDSTFRYVLEYEKDNFTRQQGAETLIPVRLGYKQGEEKLKIYEYKLEDEGEIFGIAKGVFNGYTNFLNLVDGEEIEIFGQKIFGILFFHSENSVKNFTLKGKKVGDGNLKLDIYNILENGNTDVAGGIKATKTINFSQIPTESEEFTIELDRDFTVTPNKKYVAILSCSSGNSSNKVILNGGFKIIEEIKNIRNKLDYDNSSTSFRVEKNGWYLFNISFNSENYNSYNTLTIQKNSSQIKQFSAGNGGNFSVYLSKNDNISISGSNSYSSYFKALLEVNIIEPGFYSNSGINGVSKKGESLFCKVENSKTIQNVDVYFFGFFESENFYGKNIFLNEFGFLGNKGKKILDVIGTNLYLINKINFKTLKGSFSKYFGDKSKVTLEFSGAIGIKIGEKYYFDGDGDIFYQPGNNNYYLNFKVKINSGNIVLDLSNSSSSSNTMFNFNYIIF